MVETYITITVVIGPVLRHGVRRYAGPSSIMRKSSNNFVKYKQPLLSIGYSALPSPPRLMRRAVAARRTHRHTDAERHNTLSAR